MQQRNLDRSSESFFTIYKQIHKPTGIENSIYCNFTSCKFKVLVTSVATKLEVFKLRDEFLVSKKYLRDCLFSIKIIKKC